MTEIKIPTHLAIILDGNGRWAKQRGKVRTYGHKFGADNVIKISKYANKLGIKYLSMYAFSTENRKRPDYEVNFLMKLLEDYIRDNIDEMVADNMKLHILGDISALPSGARKAIERGLEESKDCTGLVLNMAVNYGGRAELVHAFQEIAKSGVDSSEITEDMISDQLYTGGMPDPDLIIRPGGELRLSNFLIYQLAYSEFYFTDTYWPDFDEKELDKALEAYSKRQRRFGDVDESGN